jgi:hypothetical protein
MKQQQRVPAGVDVPARWHALAGETDMLINFVADDKISRSLIACHSASKSA